MDATVWFAFFVTAWAISISPGPATLFALSSGLSRGVRRSLPGMVGLVLGVWTSLAAVGVGLGGLLAGSATAFTILKWIGVGYLFYLGVQQWRAPACPLVAAADAATRDIPPRALLLRAWAVNATNPKGYVFLLALLPQFIDVTRPLLPQYLAIAAAFTITEFVVMTGYTALASRAARWFQGERRMRLMNRSFGALFMAAAAGLATFRRAA